MDQASLQLAALDRPDLCRRAIKVHTFFGEMKGRGWASGLVFGQTPGPIRAVVLHKQKGELEMSGRVDLESTCGPGVQWETLPDAGRVYYR